MEQETAEAIAKSLDRIANILAGLLVRDLAEGEQQQKIARLSQCGFQNAEIAAMLNTTANTVGVALHTIRKKRRKRRPK